MGLFDRVRFPPCETKGQGFCMKFVFEKIY